jgi:3-hydroxyisobutyrate dehydrogenase-like beta-hydroxyacid dehydrogenase
MSQMENAGAVSEVGANTVTVIGLGLMGSALAKAFVEKGHSVTVWNREPARVEPLVATGATGAPTPADAVRSSGTVVVCVSDYDAVGDVLDAAGEALAGRTLVNLTSGTPEQCRQAAARVQEAGVTYLDGAIMAIPPFIGQPQAMLLYSGSKSAFDENQALLESLGTGIYLGEDAGLAALYDLGLLCSMWSMLMGYFHAAALVGTENVSAAEFTPLVSGWLTGLIGFLPQVAEEIDKRDYATDVSKLAASAAGLEHLVHASQAQGIGVDVVAPIKDLIDRGMKAGYADESLSALMELIRQPAPSS